MNYAEYNTGERVHNRVDPCVCCLLWSCLNNLIIFPCFPHCFHCPGAEYCYRSETGRDCLYWHSLATRATLSTLVTLSLSLSLSLSLLYMCHSRLPCRGGTERYQHRGNNLDLKSYVSSVVEGVLSLRIWWYFLFTIRVLSGNKLNFLMTERMKGKNYFISYPSLMPSLENYCFFLYGQSIQGWNLDIVSCPPREIFIHCRVICCSWWRNILNHENILMLEVKP